jgi:hypothetical protein
MIHLCESSQVGHWYQNPPSDPEGGDVFVRDQIIEASLTYGKILGGSLPVYEKSIFGFRFQLLLEAF